MDGIKIEEESIYLPEDIVRKSPGFTVDVGKSGRIHARTRSVDEGKSARIHLSALPHTHRMRVWVSLHTYIH